MPWGIHYVCPLVEKLKDVPILFSILIPRDKLHNKWIRVRYPRQNKKKEKKRRERKAAWRLGFLVVLCSCLVVVGNRSTEYRCSSRKQQHRVLIGSESESYSASISVHQQGASLSDIAVKSSFSSHIL